MKPLFCLVGLFLLISASAAAQPSYPPLRSGFNKLAIGRIDNLLQQYVDSQWIAGATALVIKNDSIMYQKAVGYSNIITKQRLRNDHIFRIASQTKAITSTGIMILLEEGKLLLDQPVSMYIPAFANTRVLDKFEPKDSSYTTKDLKRPITIRDLLTHTSGIGYAQIGSPAYLAMAARAGVFSQVGVPNASLADQVNKIAQLPLEHQPGERFTYGLNIDVLGYLIEVISKQSLADFFRMRIFEPLGMKDTWFYLPADKRNRLVTLHGEDSTGHVRVLSEPMPLNGTSMDPNFPQAEGSHYSGGGGLSSTAYDYALFMQMILHQGTLNGKRIISPNSVKLMTTNQIGSLKNGYNTFGLGFGLISEKDAARLGVSEGSYEWGGAFSSTYWIDPEKKIVAQLFINQWPNTHGNVHEKFKVLVYSSLD